MTRCHELGENSVENIPKFFIRFHLTEFEMIWWKLSNQKKELDK